MLLRSLVHSPRQLHEELAAVDPSHAALKHLLRIGEHPAGRALCGCRGGAARRAPRDVLAGELDPVVNQDNLVFEDMVQVGVGGRRLARLVEVGDVHLLVLSLELLEQVGEAGAGEKSAEVGGDELNLRHPLDPDGRRGGGGDGDGDNGAPLSVREGADHEDDRVQHHRDGVHPEDQNGRANRPLVEDPGAHHPDGCVHRAHQSRADPLRPALVG
mmetsp:Transcript_27752/g.82950  ORF Transcript_27752/g.82950 Transcript_27752/m.82950 type:complete len:215 (-) Transcript_27752:341-985(-)